MLLLPASRSVSFVSAGVKPTKASWCFSLIAVGFGFMVSPFAVVVDRGAELLATVEK